MIIETDEYRNLLKTEIGLFAKADELARMNKRFHTKCGTLVVKSSPYFQIVCGNFASFRKTTYSQESGFHPEYTALDMFSTELGGLTFYISKLNIENEPLPSKPCSVCLSQLHLASEVRYIIYRDDNLRIVKEEVK